VVKRLLIGERWERTGALSRELAQLLGGV